MKNFKKCIPGLLISVVTLGVSVLFILVLFWSKMLPTTYLVMGGAAVILFALAAALLVRSTAHKVQFVFGTLIAVTMTAVMVMGTTYLMKTMSTLNVITDVRTQYTPVGVFVRADDPAESLDDAREYSFGILSMLDRENTDETVAELDTRYGHQIALEEYEGLSQLVDSLLTGETDAMILNLAYLDLFEDMEGYEETESLIRQLEVVTIEKVVEVPKKNNTTNKNDKKEDEYPHVFTMYIGGSDSRGSLNQMSRNDVNIIATVNTETKQVLLVTTPRDYYVPLSISNGSPDKLTHAGIYGVNVSRDSLAMLYETEIDYYFRINFQGVEKLVDALGGITVNNKSAFTALNTYYIPEGKVELNGAEALAYARDRKNSGGDQARGKRQMEIIKACIDKAMSPDILMKYTAILGSVEECIDTDMPYEEIADLVRSQLEDNRSWNITLYAVDGVGASRQPWSMSTNAYVLLPDYDMVDKASSLMQRVKDGEVVVVGED